MTALKRRDFLTAVAAGLCVSRDALYHSAPGIETVRGPSPPERLGLTLMHEHVMVDFVGADAISDDRYRPDEVFSVALPYLEKAYRLGCRTVVECTPAYLGRNPVLLKRLSEASGLQIITNTGYYAAIGGKYVPAHAFKESADQIAKRWIHESQNGIAGSGIKPGFIKIGVEKSPLSEIGRKLVKAAAMTHQRTGLTIASHTGNGGAAMEQLDILRGEGVSPAAFIWVHAQSEELRDFHLRAAERGAWVEFDGISDVSAARHVELVKNMIDRGHLQQTLVSMDSGWYHVGEPGGGDFHGFESLFSGFLPALRAAGATESQINTLLVSNPYEALRPRVRLL